MDAATGQPRDYSELFETYFSIMCHIVYKSGIAKEDVEDVTMDLLIKFMEKDGINYYDPTKPTKFSSMLRGFTATYVQTNRDKQAVRHKRIPWRLEALEDLQWVDPLECSLENVDTAISLQQVLVKARSMLAERKERNKDYAAFFDACVRHGLTEGRLDRDALQRELGLTTSITRRMLVEVRLTLRSLLDPEAIAVA